MSGTTIAGRGSLRIAGKVYNCTKLDPQPGNEKREKMVGLGGVVNGDKITPQAPRFSGTLIVTPDVNVTAFQALQNELAEVGMADGRNYIFGGSSHADPTPHSATDGTLDFSFECASGLEV